MVFIHGLWVLPSSWDKWVGLFEENGYAGVTPSWPDDPETVEEAGAHPDVFAKKTLKQIADHTAGVIGQLDRKPVVMGHSPAAFESYELEPEDYVDAGDSVVVVFMLRARGRGSGIELKRRDAIVYTLAERLVTRVDYFNNPAEALEAAGLSSENPEIVRRAFQAFAAGGVEALLEFVDERCVMITGGDVASEPDTYRGHDGARRYFDSFYEVMDRIAVEVLDLEELSGGQVVGSLRLTARGRASGIETGQNGEMLCAVAGGKLVRIEFFPTRGEALAAASRGWGSPARPN